MRFPENRLTPSAKIHQVFVLVRHLPQLLPLALTPILGNQCGQLGLGVITGVMNEMGDMAIEFVPPPIDAIFWFHKPLLNSIISLIVSKAYSSAFL
jgi:hypothetical protein